MSTHSIAWREAARSSRLAVLSLLAMAPEAVGEPLPLSRSLAQAAALSIDLVGAEVRVIVDAEAAPALTARSLEPDGAGELDVVVAAGGARVSRRSQREAFPRIRVEAVIPPRWPLAISGADLAIELEGRGGPGVEKAEPANGGPAVQLVVTRARVSVSGLPALGARLTDAWLVGGGLGSLEITAQGSTVEISGVAEGTRLESRESRIVLRGLESDLEATVHGGEVDVGGGAGSAVVEAHDALLRLTQRTGTTRLSGAHSSLELAALSGGATLAGEDLQVRLEGASGRVVAELTGGTLAVSELAGDLRLVTAGSIDVQVSKLTGELGVEAGEGAQLTVSGARALRGNIAGGVVWAEGVTRVDLGAERSRVTLRGVASIARLALTDCEAELDLTALGANPTLSLLGTTRGRARLKSPCIVSSRVAGGAAGGDGVGAGNVQVAGCDLNAPGQGLATQALRKNWGGQARLLNVELADTARLEVSSEP